MASGTLSMSQNSQPSPFSDYFLRLPHTHKAKSNAAPACSTGTLAKAMSLVMLEDNGNNDMTMSQDLAQSQQYMTQQGSLTQTHSRDLQGVTRRLALDLSQQTSQELLLCTPDFATPVDQHHKLDYPSITGDDEVSRSPAPSPMRFQKRPRPMTEMDSDTLSQTSQSQSFSQPRSQGEISTCHKAGPGGLISGKPPMHPGGRVVPRKRVEPPVIRNPYLNPDGDDLCIYQTSCSSRGEPIPPKQHRMMWDYKQEERLGSGNFSNVYRVVHRMSGKAYALKRSKRPVQTAADRNMWLAEIQALAAVEGHPNVITYYDSWVEPAEGGEHVCIKLELCGESLTAAWHAAGGSGQGGQRAPMKEGELVEVMRQMASALRHIHSLGLAHLDLKPDNIYRARPQGPPPSLAHTLVPQGSGSWGRPGGGLSMCGGPSSQSSQGYGNGVSTSPTASLFKLGDFGLATSKTAASGLTEGDARYLAPELLSGRSESGLDKADMFALGATLYELATGAPLPTGGERYAALRHGQLMMMPCVSVKLQALIKRLMSPDPRQRPSAEQVLRSPVLTGSGGSGNLAAIAVSPRAMSEL